MFLINTKLVVDGKGNKNIFTKNISTKKIYFSFFYKYIREYIKKRSIIQKYIASSRLTKKVYICNPFCRDIVRQMSHLITLNII